MFSGRNVLLFPSSGNAAWLLALRLAHISVLAQNAKDQQDETTRNASLNPLRSSQHSPIFTDCVNPASRTYIIFNNT